MLTKNFISILYRLSLIIVLVTGILGLQPAKSVRAAALIVTNTNDSGAGSLRKTIADAVAGDTITFDSLLSGQIIALSTTLVINKDLTIDGSSLTSPITISGQQAYRVFYVNSGITATLGGLIIALGHDIGGGSGIYNAGTLTVMDSTFVSNGINQSGAGGGIFNAGTLTLTNTTFYSNGNGTEIDGGGIYNMGTLTVTNSTFAYNGGVHGGGIYNNMGTLTVTNSTFAYNGTAHGGGGIYSTGTLNLVNTIIANSANSGDCFSVASLATNINNLVEDGSCAASISGDPKLAPLADNGGPTQTMALMPGSPAINAGDDEACPGADQRGVNRPQGGRCDIGAYEAIVYYVKWNADGNNDGTSWENAFTNLQSALAAAFSGDEIWVAAGTYKPTTGKDRTISFTLENGVALYGGFVGTETLLAERNPATHVAILSGNIGVVDDSSDNSYHVVVGSGTNNTAVLDGFTITAGNANGDVYDAHQSYGGGMFNYLGSPTLTNVIFSENSARVWGGGLYNLGGYIYLQNVGSNPILTNVVFSGNSAVEGGGMRNAEYSHPILNNVTFSNNTSTRAGGGLANINYSSPTLNNVTFDHNTSAGGGGISNWNGSNPSLTNVTFYANAATDEGGAIYNGGGSDLIFTNITMSGNTATQGGGLYNEYGSNSDIVNSILYGNSGGQIYDASGTISVTYSMVQGGYPGTGNLDADPELAALADNGGFTQTMALLPGSPAINAGTNVGCPSTDQRGVSRPQGGVCDIGAYEFQKKVGGNTVGVFRPSNGLIYLKNSNTTGYADVAINYGMGGDYPIAGDWDGDGTDTIGVYRNGVFYLRNSNTVGYADVWFPFGAPGDQPIAGDWDGDGIDTIGVLHGNTFYLRNSNTAGDADYVFQLGIPGDIGIAGDWTHQGFDTVGVFRPTNGFMYLKNTNTTGYADIALNYGIGGDQPVVGDWDNNGTDTIGILRGNTFYLRNSNTVGYADMWFDLGVPGDMPIAGNWDGIP